MFKTSPLKEICRSFDTFPLHILYYNLPPPPGLELSISLLSKWKWRTLNDKEFLWYPLLCYKYGKADVMSLSRRSWPNASQWWRDIQDTSYRFEGVYGWFEDLVQRKVGSGNQTAFWSHKWLDNLCLKDMHPRLFQVATNKEATIADMLADTNSRNTWKWTWFQHLFSWEEKLLEDLITKLQGVIVQLVKHLQRSSPLPGDCS